MFSARDLYNRNHVVELSSLLRMYLTEKLHFRRTETYNTVGRSSWQTESNWYTTWIPRTFVTGNQLLNMLRNVQCYIAATIIQFRELLLSDTRGDSVFIINIIFSVDHYATDFDFMFTVIFNSVCSVIKFRSIFIGPLKISLDQDTADR